MSGKGSAMERCKTCKHWTPENGNYPNRDTRREKGEGGQCSNNKLREEWGFKSYEADALVYPYAEGAETFWAGPEFGCVHHEKDIT